MRGYLSKLADDGYHVLSSIPVWVADGIPSNAFTDVRYQIAAKTAITRQNCAIDRTVYDAPVILVYGTHAFRPMPTEPVPWYDGWVMRGRKYRMFSTVYLSKNVFLEPFLLPLLKTINKRTTLIPKSAKVTNGVWSFALGNFENDVHYNEQNCDWERYGEPNSDTKSLRYAWEHSEELTRKYINNVSESTYEEAILSCHTRNRLIIPTNYLPDRLEILIVGESIVRVGGKTGTLEWSKESTARWSGLIHILPGARGFTFKFKDRIEPAWEPVQSEGDYPFDVSGFHIQHLGLNIKTDDIVWGSRMLQDQCIFLAPGLQDYMISSPIIQPSGGLILQVYAGGSAHGSSTSPLSVEWPQGRPDRYTGLENAASTTDQKGLKASLVELWDRKPYTERETTEWNRRSSTDSEKDDIFFWQPERKTVPASPPPAYGSLPDTEIGMQQFELQVLNDIDGKL